MAAILTLGGRMKVYESTYVIEGKVPETEVDKLVEKFSAIVKGSGGEVLSMEKLGKRELAYRVGHSKEGFYVYMELKLDGVMVKELERNYKIADQVIRFLTVLKEDRKPSKRKIRKPRPAPVTSAPASPATPAAAAPVAAAPAAPAAAPAPDAPKAV